MSGPIGGNHRYFSPLRWDQPAACGITDPTRKFRCPMTPSSDISRLLEIMAALRTPVTGCPWDLEQDFATIAPYTIEEAYEVVEAITQKMIRRHPHVFADKDGKLAPSHVKELWDRIKAEEKAERAARRPPEQVIPKSLLSGIKAGQPALTRAMELQRKASTVGFDWNDPRAVLAKIREEA